MPEPHWDDLKIFLVVAREESLSAAGRVLRAGDAVLGAADPLLRRTRAAV